MFTPSEIASNYVGIVRGKVSRRLWKTFVLAVLAGAFIALGGALATVASAGFEGTQASLLKGAVFPLGLILVVVCGAELFTGNCLFLAPMLSKEVKTRRALLNLGVVYCGNLTGAVLIALLVVYGHAFGTQTAAACVNTAAAKCNLNFADGLLRGILCNILVCLAVWASMASRNVGGKILAVYLPVFAFVVCGFEHSVANMYYLSSGLLASAEYAIAATGLGLGNALVFGLLSSTLGNIVGGGLIALAYWAVFFQKSEKKGKE